MFLIKKIISKIYFLVFLFHSVWFQETKSREKPEPIEIFAENGIEWHKNDNKYLAVGNAKAIQGSLSVKADVIEALYKESGETEMNITKVRAHKNVSVNDDKLVITGGSQAEFDIDKDYFKIRGKSLELTSESDKLNANQKIEYWRAKNVAIALGKATATKKDKFTIKSEKLVWHIKKNGDVLNVIKILGFKNVSIKTQNEVAFSDKALYNKEREICKLFGNVKLQKGDSVLVGDYAEVNMKTGISRLLPLPGSTKLGGEKVKALIKKNRLNDNERSD